jgi:hypothetical protein
MPRPAIAYLATPRHAPEGWLQQWLERLQSFATGQGLLVTRVYVDDPNSRRAGLLSLRSDLDSRVADVVITPSERHLARGGASRQALRRLGAVVVEIESPQVIP